MTQYLTLALCMWTLLQQPTAPAQPAAPTRIGPVDEGTNDPSFQAFRQQLLEGVQKRDLTRVLAFISADVQVTLDARQHGLAALKSAWQLDRSPQRFLRELETVVKLGGRFSQSSCTFVAPYVWTEFPESLYDIDYVVVMRDQAPILARPGVGTPVATASVGDLLVYDLGEPGWMHVTTAEGKSGFIKRSAVRMPNAFRAYFTKIMEDWKLVGFFEGID
jgi:hypothetical protein